MKFSIIIAAYNGVELTKECLSSLFSHASNKNGYELIFINDGSTDGTHSLLTSLSKENANLKYISHIGNMGPIPRRNEGIRIATGDYLLFLDNDTVWNNNALQFLEDRFQDLPQAGIVGMCGIFIPNMSMSYHIHGSLLSQSTEVHAVPTYCMMVSRKVIDRGIVFDENLEHIQHEDVDFCLQAIEKKFKVYAIPNVPLVHREHGSLKHYKNDYRRIFESNWNYLIKKWNNNKIFNKTLLMPPFKKQLSIMLENATFYDLV